MGAYICTHGHLHVPGQCIIHCSSIYMYTDPFKLGTWALSHDAMAGTLHIFINENEDLMIC